VIVRFASPRIDGAIKTQAGVGILPLAMTKPSARPSESGGVYRQPGIGHLDAVANAHTFDDQNPPAVRSHDEPLFPEFPLG
jgi:hypothetical protein